MYLIVSANISYLSKSLDACAWSKALLIPNREWKITSGLTLLEVNDVVKEIIENTPYSWRFRDKVDPRYVTIYLS